MGNVSQAEADQTLEVLLQFGVNHLDTAASYGEAELRMGPWLERYRDRFFLATKTGERTYQAAFDQIQRSLERLRVPSVDLLQLHNLVDEIEWTTAMGAGGALEAAIEARRQGLARFIGVTGHGTTVARMHLRSLAQFDFDSVLLPYSVMMMRDQRYAEDFEELFALCRQRNVAVQTIKAVTRGPWGDRPQNRATWYQPLEEQADIDTAVHWVLGRSGVFLNTVGDIDLLPKVLNAAARFQSRPSEAAVGQLIDRAQIAPLFV